MGRIKEGAKRIGGGSWRGAKAIGRGSKRIGGGSWRGAKAIGRGSKRIGGGVKTIARGPSRTAKETLAAPLAIPGILIRWIFWIIAVVIGFFLLFSLIIMIYYGFGEAELPEWIGIKIEEWGLSPYIGKIVSMWYSTVTLEFLTQEDTSSLGGAKVSEESDFALKITDFSPEEKNIYTNEDIIAYAQLEVGKTHKDRDVIIIELLEGCYLEDYLPEYGAVSALPPIIDIMPGMENQIIDVMCVFERGIPLTDKEIVKSGHGTKKIRLSADINVFDQKVSWLPFIKRNWEKGDLTEKNSAAKDGPAELILWTTATQPFYENRLYTLRVSLKSMLSWGGTIKEVNDIIIETEDSIRLNTQNKACDFVESGNNYRIKTSELQRVNIDCTNTEVLKELGRKLYRGSKITQDKCIEQMKSEFEFNCPFEVVNGKSVVEKTKITAKADYVFEMTKTTGVKVSETPKYEEEDIIFEDDYK